MQVAALALAPRSAASHGAFTRTPRHQLESTARTRYTLSHMDDSSALHVLPALPSKRERHTFRGNLKSSRHGWLRLTPAYSVRLVDELLASGAGAASPVLDPFCGTGTTLLACAEHQVDCDSVDINPFLIWLARTKLGSYSSSQLAEAQSGLAKMRRAALRDSAKTPWLPPLHQIEKWWNSATLLALGRAWEALERVAVDASRPAANLLRVAFCQVLIERSRAHFGHQSMSLTPSVASAEPAASDRGGENLDAVRVAEALGIALQRLLQAAAVPLPDTRRRLVQLDARRLHEKLALGHYGSVITSPPYANRMSYIRELRPYMYWLRYLRDRKTAGVLDWHAIGGTWGAATSKLGTWVPGPSPIPAPPGLEPLLLSIAERSAVLSTYVRKYFHDMSTHLESLARVMRSGGTAFFVIGNSKFYDVVVPVERLLATQFEQLGFQNVDITTLRKRTSKKELYEYLVTARKA
jgi:hypothetical protein